MVCSSYLPSHRNPVSVEILHWWVTTFWIQNRDKEVWVVSVSGAQAGTVFLLISVEVMGKVACSPPSLLQKDRGRLRVAMPHFCDCHMKWENDICHRVCFEKQASERGCFLPRAKRNTKFAFSQPLCPVIFASDFTNQNHDSNHRCF